MPRPARAGTSGTSCSGAWPAAQRGTSSCSPRLRTAATTLPSTGCSACSPRTSSAWRRSRARNADVSANASRTTSSRDGAPTSRNGTRATSSRVARRRSSPTRSAETGRHSSTKSSTTAPRSSRPALGTSSGSVSTSGGRWPSCAAAGRAPVAAVLALRTRAGEDPGDEAREDLLDRIFDGDVDALVEDDVEPRPVAIARHWHG